jgi:hypothetical protein
MSSLSQYEIKQGGMDVELHAVILIVTVEELSHQFYICDVLASPAVLAGFCAFSEHVQENTVTLPEDMPQSPFSKILSS